MYFTITFACANGHEQQVQVDASIGRKAAEVAAGLMDGTSALYVYPPDANSRIGKCGICGARVRASVD